MDSQTARQPLRDSAILNNPAQDGQLMPAGQRFLSTFEAAIADSVEDQTCSGRTEPARRQHGIGSLQSAAIRYDHPKEPIGCG